MISICPYLLDTSGMLFIEHENPNNTVFTGGRRVSRTATLDGSVTVTDSGFVDGDRTFSLTLSPFSLAELQAVERIFQYHQQVTVSLRDGAYLAIPEDYSARGNSLRFSLLVKSKISA